MPEVLRAGPASMTGACDGSLGSGQSPMDAWACAMGWGLRAAQSHSQRLEREGWLRRYAMTRGHGSLLVATDRGIRVGELELSAAPRPTPTWWAHDCACAWTAAWLTVRRAEWRGPREVLADPELTGKLEWQTRTGWRRSTHRPDLTLAIPDGQVVVEVELQRKDTKRLAAILSMYRELDGRVPDRRGRLRVRQPAPRRPSSRVQPRGRPTCEGDTDRAARRDPHTDNTNGRMIALAASLAAFWICVAVGARRRMANATPNHALGSQPLPRSHARSAPMRRRRARALVGCTARRSDLSPPRRPPARWSDAAGGWLTSAPARSCATTSSRGAGLGSPRRRVEPESASTSGRRERSSASGRGRTPSRTCP